MQIVRKSVRLRKMACHLVERCGLFSWLSSALSLINEMLSGDEKGFYFDQLVVILEVVTPNIYFLQIVIFMVPFTVYRKYKTVSFRA